MTLITVDSKAAVPLVIPWKGLAVDVGGTILQRPHEGYLFALGYGLLEDFNAVTSTRRRVSLGDRIA